MMESWSDVSLPREEDITEAVADYLRDRWHVLGTHHPGASGGIRLQPNPSGAGAELPAVIPDVVAARALALLLVESKPRFSPADVRKLRAVVLSGAYAIDAVRVAGLSPHAVPRLIPAIAYCPQGGEPHPEGFVVFHYLDNRIQVESGAELLDVG